MNTSLVHSIPAIKFDRRLARFLTLPLVALLFTPKINLVAFQGSTTGLRLDDLFIGVFFLFFYCLHFRLRLPILPSERLVGSFVALGCVSALLNSVFYSSGNSKDLILGVFYAVRPLEYFTFFYVGLIASRYFNAHRIVQWLFVVVFLVTIFQSVGVLGAFSVYGHGIASVKVGICSFTSEAGALLNLLYSYLELGRAHGSFRVITFFKTGVQLPSVWSKLLVSLRPILILVVFGFLNIIVGHRAGLAILVFLAPAALLGRLAHRRSRRYLSTILLYVMMALTALVIGSKSKEVSSRSSNLMRTENFEMIRWAWEHTSVGDNRMTEVTGDGFAVDMSWWMRLHKWCWAVKNFLNRPLAPLIGIGPGFCGAALDGGILRLVLEYGIIGASLFFSLLLGFYRLGASMKWTTVALVLNMILFDAHLAYKLMSVYFFMGGVRVAGMGDRAKVCSRSEQGS